MTNIKGINCVRCRHVLYMQSGRQGNVPPSKFPDLKYCPVCGEEGEECKSLDDAWWLEMSYYYGLGVDVMKQLYGSGWIETHKTFDAYIKDMIRAALGVK